MDFVTPLLGLLVPHLPALVKKAAEDVAGEGAKKIAFAAVPAGVKAIWAKLWPKVEASAVAKESAKAIEADPEDQDSIEMLKLALKKMLKEIEKSEPELLGELKQLMEGEKSSGKTYGDVKARDIYGLAQGDRATQTFNFGTQPNEEKPQS